MKVITLAGEKFLIVEKSRAVAVKHIVGFANRLKGGGAAIWCDDGDQIYTDADFDEVLRVLENG